MKNRNLIIKIFIGIIAILICVLVYFNTGLKGFEREIDNIKLSENIKKIAIKSDIGDSGGNGNQSTYRVVLVVKTEMSKSDLENELENKNLTFNYYITECKGKVFESPRSFKLTFDKLDGINDFSGYYFIEFIK